MIHKNKKSVKKTGSILMEPGISSYLIVWIVLIVFTGITVLAAELHLGIFTVIVCLGIAAFKSILVFLYFMHLRYEKRLFIKLLVPSVIVTLAVVIGLTFTDIMAR